MKGPQAGLPALAGKQVLPSERARVGGPGSSSLGDRRESKPRSEAEMGQRQAQGTVRRSGPPVQGPPAQGAAGLQVGQQAGARTKRRAKAGDAQPQPSAGGATEAAAERRRRNGGRSRAPEAQRRPQPSAGGATEAAAERRRRNGGRSRNRAPDLAHDDTPPAGIFSFLVPNHSLLGAEYLPLGCRITLFLVPHRSLLGAVTRREAMAGRPLELPPHQRGSSPCGMAS